jgi:hypothetical protein
MLQVHLARTIYVLYKSIIGMLNFHVKVMVRTLDFWLRYLT